VVGGQGEGSGQDPSDRWVEGHRDQVKEADERG
jgi:hypothetical protein